jgi:hypothetical protein
VDGQGVKRVGIICVWVMCGKSFGRRGIGALTTRRSSVDFVGRYCVTCY